MYDHPLPGFLPIVLERPADQQRAEAIGRDHYYALIRERLRPTLIKRGNMSFGLRHERETIAAAIACGKSDEELKALVLELEAARPKIFERLKGAVAAAIT